MPFSALKLLRRSVGGYRPGPVMMCANGGEGRQSRFFRIIFRPTLLSAELPWLKHGAKATVELGYGKDEGYLLISAGAEFLIFILGGGKTKKAKPLFIAIPEVAGSKPGAQKPTECDYSVLEGGMLLIEMPEWAYARSEKQVPQPATSPVPYKIGAPSHAEVMKQTSARGK